MKYITAKKNERTRLVKFDEHFARAMVFEHHPSYVQRRRGKFRVT